MPKPKGNIRHTILKPVCWRWYFGLIKNEKLIQSEVKVFDLLEEGSSSIKQFAQKEDIFDMINDVHLAVGHGGWNRMIKKNTNS